MSDPTRKEEIRDALGSIDQIRDIIFGAQMRDYNSRMDRLETDLTRFQHDTRDRLDQLKDKLLLELKQSIESLEKRLRSVDSTARADRDELRQQIDRLSQRVSSTSQDLDTEIDRQTHALRGELTQTRDQFQGDLSTLRSVVMAEIDRRFSSLGETKVSKDDIAETLMELGMRLKGTDLIPQLRDVAEADRSNLPEATAASKPLTNGFAH